MDNGIKGIIILISVILSFLAGLNLFPFYTTGSATCPCVADAFVYSAMPNLNTGTYTEAVPSIDWGKLEYRYVYMMFDISSIPEYAQVTGIRILTYFSYISPTSQGQMYGVTWAETNWSENTITWNKQPATGVPGAWELQLFGGAGQKEGYFSWVHLEGTAPRLMTHLKTDKKMGYILFPDLLNRYASMHYMWMRTKEYGGGFEPKLYVDYTIPSYTLTVSVKDADNSPIYGATITSPFSAKTDANGLASSTLEIGAYTVGTTYMDLTYTQSVTLDANKTVTFIIPMYTLTIKTVDEQENPISEVIITSPVSGKTGASGTFSTRQRAGTYTITVAFGTVQKSESVTLDYSKTVTITLVPEYTISFKVIDQAGNPLPARITFDSETVTCDKYGLAIAKVTKTKVEIKAEIKVGTQTYSSTSDTLTLIKSITKEITIVRRFLWKFYINYTDGSVATGRIIATSTRESLNISIVSGYGEAYFLNTLYQFSFEASPAVVLKTVSITNDGELYATLTKPTPTRPSTAETTTTAKSVASTPEIPWILIPSIYIYALLGVLVLGFIIAVIVRYRRPLK